MGRPRALQKNQPDARSNSLFDRPNSTRSFTAPLKSGVRQTQVDVETFVPLTRDATDITCVKHKILQNESFELQFESRLSKKDIESFYGEQLAELGFRIQEMPVIMPAKPFLVSGETPTRPLLICGEPNCYTVTITTRAEELQNDVSVRTCPTLASSGQADDALIEPSAAAAHSIPSLVAPAGSTIRTLGSVETESEITQSASLRGNTSVSQIISSFLTSLTDSGFRIELKEISKAIGFIEWSSVETGDKGVVSVIRIDHAGNLFKLTSRTRFGPKTSRKRRGRSSAAPC